MFEAQCSSSSEMFVDERCSSVVVCNNDIRHGLFFLFRTIMQKKKRKGNQISLKDGLKSFNSKQQNSHVWFSSFNDVGQKSDK